MRSQESPHRIFAGPEFVDEDGQPWVLMVVCASELSIDTSYQTARRFNQTKAEDIAAHWDWALCDPIKVGLYPDGMFYIVCGQHRVYAARARFGDDVELPAYVGETTSEKAARIFAREDLVRRRVDTATRFGALLRYGDAESMAIVEIAGKHGWSVSTSGSPSTRSLACIALLQRCLRQKSGSERLDRVLRVLTAAWGHQKNTGSHFLIGGLNRFLRDHETTVDDNRLIDRLRSVPPEEVMGPMARRYALELGRHNQASTQNYLPVSLVIRDLYNYRLAKSRQL